MNVKVGSCPDSWGVWFPDDPKQIPWNRFLDEVAEAGYEWIELGPYGYLPTDINRLLARLKPRAIKSCKYLRIVLREICNESRISRLLRPRCHW